MASGFYKIYCDGVDDIDRYVLTQCLSVQLTKVEMAPNKDDANLIISSDFFGEPPYKIGMVLDKIDKAIFENAYDQVIQYGDFTLQWSLSTVKINNKNIDLTDRERDIMAELLIAKSQGCDRDYLLNKIWGYRNDLETHTLETHIYRLRQKIEAEPDNPAFLITIDRGYKINQP